MRTDEFGVRPCQSSDLLPKHASSGHMQHKAPSGHDMRLCVFGLLDVTVVVPESSFDPCLQLQHARTTGKPAAPGTPKLRLNLLYPGTTLPVAQLLERQPEIFADNGLVFCLEAFLGHNDISCAMQLSSVSCEFCY